MSRRYMERRDGLLAVECWCGRRVVHVEPDDVRRGVTKRCGRRECLALAMADERRRAGLLVPR